MNRHGEHGIPCQVCGVVKPRGRMTPAGLVRESIAEIIRKDHPEWSAAGYICHEDLDHYRTEYVRRTLAVEKGELSNLEESVVRSLEQQDILSQDLNREFAQKLTFGQRLSDRLAEVAGSWMFISVFLVVIVAWITLNAITLLGRPFDPFPFILLNLVLSCVAAVQAPVIMMSQNRQESKDRLRAEHDYRINLKAELEIRALHGKLDQLLHHQWQRLLEIQEIQLEILGERRDQGHSPH